jgi:hypothetical protein
MLYPAELLGHAMMCIDRLGGQVFPVMHKPVSPYENCLKQDDPDGLRCRGQMCIPGRMRSSDRHEGRDGPPPTLCAVIGSAI